MMQVSERVVVCALCASACGLLLWLVVLAVTSRKQALPCSAAGSGGTALLAAAAPPPIKSGTIALGGWIVTPVGAQLRVCFGSNIDEAACASADESDTIVVAVINGNSGNTLSTSGTLAAFGAQLSRSGDNEPALWSTAAASSSDGLAVTGLGPAQLQSGLPNTADINQPVRLTTGTIMRSQA